MSCRLFVLWSGDKVHKTWGLTPPIHHILPTQEFLQKAFAKSLYQLCFDLLGPKPPNFTSGWPPDALCFARNMPDRSSPSLLPHTTLAPSVCLLQTAASLASGMRKGGLKGDSNSGKQRPRVEPFSQSRDGAQSKLLQETMPDWMQYKVSCTKEKNFLILLFETVRTYHRFVNYSS
jgi:hypothetical protein